jgi:hypothetical protein
LFTGYVCLTTAIGNRIGWTQLAGDDLNSFRFFFFVVAPIVALIWVAIASLMLKWTVNRLFGGGAAWNATFAVWMYASLPLAVMLLLAAATAHWFAKSTFDWSQLPSTLPAVLSGPAAASRLVFLTAALAVHVWFIILLSLGIAKIADVSRKAGFISVVGWDVLFLAWNLASTIATYSGR